MTEEYRKKTAITVILGVLIVLSFFIVRPILLSVITGILLAFIFYPLYKRLKKLIKSENLSALLICILTIVLLVLPLWFLTPLLIRQSFEIFQATQNIDIISILERVLPAEIFAHEAISTEIGSTLQNLVTTSTSYIMGFFADLLRNFPNIFLQIVVVFFTFFFVLRDGEKLIHYIRTLLPFSKDTEDKLFSQSKNITYAVIYGQIIIGIIQGIIVSISYFIFDVPNALFLSFLSTIAGVLPVIGPVLVWVPVSIYLIVSGNDTAFFGVLIFGLFASTIDNFIRPVIVSARTKVPTSLVFIGMIGGLFLFGILGLILGPLILAYLVIILELYRGKPTHLFETETS